MWNFESKIWQSVRSGIKNLQSVRIRIRNSHRVNFQIQFLSTWQISQPKKLNLSDFESKISQRVSCRIKMFMCQISNQKVNNVSDLEPNSYKKICHILIGKFYNACDFLNQKLYNVSDSDAKLHNASPFESNASHFLLFYIRKCTKFLTSEGKFYKNFTFQSNFLQGVRSWNQIFWNLSELESKVVHRVRYRIKKFTTCQIYIQNIYNVSDVVSKFLERVGSAIKQIQRVTLRLKVFTTC